jgi:hypothetical protein
MTCCGKVDLASGDVVQLVRTLPCHRLPTQSIGYSLFSSQSTPLARQFSLTFGTGCFTQIRTPACHAGGRGFESRRSRQVFDLAP